MPTTIEIAQDLMKAKSEWEDATLESERAEAAREYAEKRLILARNRLNLDFSRTDPHDQWVDNQEDRDFWDAVSGDLDSIRYLGEPIGVACREALRALKETTADELVEHLTRHGFRFSTAAPAREVFGAMVKQMSWARRDSKTGKWNYIIN